jgi:hypothetical protein
MVAASLNAFFMLNHRNRCYPSLLRGYKELYGSYSKKAFTIKTNGFVYHHCDPMTEQEQKHWDNRSAIVYPNVISEIEETKLVSILAPKFQR